MSPLTLYLLLAAIALALYVTATRGYLFASVLFAAWVAVEIKGAIRKYWRMFKVWVSLLMKPRERVIDERFWGRPEDIYE